MHPLRHRLLGLLAVVAVLAAGLPLTTAPRTAEAAGPFGLCLGSGCVIGTPTVY